MSEAKTRVICTVCPLGCEIEVTGSGADAGVSGAGCPRGVCYARDEAAHPVRILTSSVRVAGGAEPLVPVRSNAPLPRESIARCMEVIRAARADAPVAMYDVLVADILGTGVDIVATGGVTGLRE